MTDLEWARAFLGGEMKDAGIRFNETVKVLVKKLAEVRQEAARLFPASAKGNSQSSEQNAKRSVLTR